MNSEKKKGGEQSQKVGAVDGSQVTSFKALKIQMIESVLPEEKSISDKKMPFEELRKR